MRDGPAGRVLAVGLLILAGLAAPAGSQVPLIVDTDFGGDADDLGALVMLHTLMDAGECEILAVMSWNTERYAVPAIDAVNRYHGRPDIPIGVRGDGEWHEPWQYGKAIADAFGSRRTRQDVPDATSLYRRVLAAQPDGSVTVLTLGPLLNLQRLLVSAPDSIAPATGRELIARKVRELVIMGGHFPAGVDEWNFDGGMPGVTRFVLDHLDVPVTFVGYEIGARVRTGRGLNRAERSPLTVGYRHFSEHAPWIEEEFTGQILDNASYDQAAALYAVRGGVGRYWTRVRGGRVEVAEDGDNRWVPGDPGPQSYLVLTAEPDSVAAVIEALMLGTPGP